ncbi:hypothetical protein AVEN_224179-1 [Araneus ventricosus]|uniref:Retrotransposon gag domain-containing protein n=1 Tax=Araneus ventricosus TaxID=182803 RepID=A0A4Y2HRQ0_ARAVE|nr:hypothetical protein AVEN_224179-1 [Araneus ventricosus]
MPPKKQKEFTISMAASLNCFSGEVEENFDFFLDLLESLATLEEWSVEKKLLTLKLHLKGKALKFLSDDISNEQQNNFEELVGLLKKKFSRSVSFEILQNKFNKIVQQPGQSVKDLAEEISNAANRYFNKGNSKNPEICTLTEKMKFSKFLESVRPDIRTQVKILGPSSFEEAVKQACNAEIAFNDTAAASSNVFTPAEVNILLAKHFESSKKIEELNKKIENLSQISVGNHSASEPWDRSAFNRNDHGSTALNVKIECHICGKGHITTECWYFPRESNAGSHNSHPQRFYNRGNFYPRRGFRNTRSRPFHQGRNNRNHPYHRRNLNF